MSRATQATVDTWLPYMPKKVCDDSLGMFERRRLSKETLQELLQIGMTSGKAMTQACIALSELLRRDGVVQKNGFYVLPMTVKKWMEGSEVLYDDDSKVYRLKLGSQEQSDFIVKTDKPETMVREYIIGRVMNEMRDLIPNYMYTFGIFKGASSTALFLEKIQGASIKASLSNMTFQEFLQVFCQLLLAFEVAQRKVGFCHFDTHVDNVILRPVDTPYEYTLSFDETNTQVKVVTNRIPVIIDYGLSCIEGSNRRPEVYRSLRGITKYGIYNACIPGADAYKFLYSCAMKAKGDLRTAILGLFAFYPYDPYSCASIKPKTMVDNYFKEYLQKFAISRSASFTPVQFLSWILSKWSVPGISMTVDRNKAQVFPSPKLRNMMADVLNQTIDNPNRELVNQFVQEALRSRVKKGASVNQALRWAKTLLTINTSAV